MLVSGFPDVQSAMSAIILEADEILVKPVSVKEFAELIREKLVDKKPPVPSPKERVALILKRCSGIIVHDWLTRVKAAKELNHIDLTDKERTGHLPRLMEDLIARLGKPVANDKDSDAICSEAAVAHGLLRFQQRYTPAMLVHESRILQVTLFGTLKNNLDAIDFSLLLPDVMTIADEVDAQLTQTVDAFMQSMTGKAVAA